MVTIVCTRKINPFRKYKLKEIGIQIRDYDFLQYEYLDTPSIRLQLEQNTCPFVFTSSHAVSSIQRLVDTGGLVLKVTGCYAILGKTSSQASEAGFDLVGSGNNASALAREIIWNKEPEVLHCTASKRRKELYERLRRANIKISSCEVYRKTSKIHQVETFDGIVFFSPSQYDAFRKSNVLPGQTPAFCIGTTTADHLRQAGHQHIIVAPETSEEATLNQVVEYFNAL